MRHLARLLGGWKGVRVECSWIVTFDAAALFYGTTMFVAAWRAQPGCEATVLSNWILRRDDQIGCPTFAPIDEAEARLTARNRAARTPAQPERVEPRVKGASCEPRL